MNTNAFSSHPNQLRTASLSARCSWKGLFAALASLVLAVTGNSVKAQSVAFDVSDVSYLWPVPTSKDEAEGLVAADELIADGTSSIWPDDAFKAVIEAALSVKSTESPVQIFVPPALEDRHNWKLVAVRIDPSALGTHESSLGALGARPQLRLVFQPVVADAAGKAKVHDFAAHLVYDIILRNDPNTVKSNAPDVERFRRLVTAISDLKAALSQQGIKTSGASLGVHPGFKSAEFGGKLKSMLKSHLRPDDLGAISFMGIRAPEPWVFFATTRAPDGRFVVFSDHPSLKGEKLQILQFEGRVIPLPRNFQFKDVGVSTAQIFSSNAKLQLDAPLFPNGQRSDLSTLRMRDIPDIIANPLITNFFNTDCVSCHSESSRRSDLDIQASNSQIQYQKPGGIGGVDKALLPEPSQRGWNVHNFGWFPNALVGGATSATVTQRTTNESTESADFINRKYLGIETFPVSAVGQPVPPAAVVHKGAAPQPGELGSISNALTLVMKIKSQKDLQELADLLNPPPSSPPEKQVTQARIEAAMNKLGSVHTARFVLRPDKMELLIITNYDNSFEIYIQSFTEVLGDIFGLLLSHMENSPPLPINDHLDEFFAYVKANDLSFKKPTYSAYPGLGVEDILQLQRDAGKRTP